MFSLFKKDSNKSGIYAKPEKIKKSEKKETNHDQNQIIASRRSSNISSHSNASNNKNSPSTTVVQKLMNDRIRKLKQELENVKRMIANRNHHNYVSLQNLTNTSSSNSNNANSLRGLETKRDMLQKEYDYLMKHRPVPATPTSSGSSRGSMNGTKKKESVPNIKEIMNNINKIGKHQVIRSAHV